ALVQHDHRYRDARWPFPDDRADPRDGGLARPKENFAAERRHLPGRGRNVHHPGPGHDPAGRSSQLSAGLNSWPNRGTLPYGPGKIVLGIMTDKYTHEPPSLFDWKIAGPAIGDSFRKLDPRLM